MASTSETNDNSSKILQPTLGEDANFIAFDLKSPTHIKPVQSANVQDSNHKSYVYGSPLRQDTFAPQGFSSPIHKNQYNVKQNHWPNNKSYNRNGGRTPYKQNQQHRKGGYDRPNYQNRYTYHQDNKDSPTKGANHTIDINEYFHPSMLEDPWANFDTNISSSSETNSNQCETG